MSFLFPSLLSVGLPLIALPLIIHLINLRRRKRIEWAAMDFLMESRKRRQKSILLKQLLLLALRTLAVACIVFMLAGPVVRSAWAALFGSGVTHHLICLDDSFSMSDRQGERLVWDEAVRVAARIVEAGRQRPGRQIVTLLPFSVAQTLAAGEGPAVHREPLNDEFAARFAELLAGLKPSSTAAGPLDALRAAERLPQAADDETRIVYLLSDFRAPQWSDRGALAEQAAKVRAQASQLQLIHCVDQTRPNLAVTRLEPVAGLRAAGIETWMLAAVRNFGDAPAPATTLEVRHNDARLPALQFDEIPPGGEEVRQFRVGLSAEGSRLEVELPADALEIDNRRFFAAAPPTAFPVLLVDESPRGEDGRYLAAALDPGQRNLSGWSPRLERRGFLARDEDLGRFAAIFLLDVPRLEPLELERLSQYAAQGGGVAWFLGPQTQPAFYNESLYRGGEGLLPAPLDTPRQLAADRSVGASDVQVADDELFRVFQGQRNSFLSLVRVDFYYALDPAWAPPKDGSVETLARLRNRAPLVLRKRFGDGQCVAQLCRVSPLPAELGAWSNLSLNPAFPVYANELAGKLSASRRDLPAQLVTSPLTFVAPLADYQSAAQIRPPAAASQAPFPFDARQDGDFWSADLPTPVAPGIWEAAWTPREATETAAAELRQLRAVNVDPREGDLHALDQQQLGEVLDGLDWQFSRSSQFAESADELAGYNLTTALVATLGAVLLGEQLAAYAASFHAAERSVAS